MTLSELKPGHHAEGSALSLSAEPFVRLNCFEGASGLGGNAYLIECGLPDRPWRLLLDCGSVPLRGKAPSWVEKVGPLDAIFISHAHLDHCSALPWLWRSQPRVPTFATPETRRLCDLALAQSPAYASSSKASTSSKMVPSLSSNSLSGGRISQRIRCLPFKQRWKPRSPSSPHRALSPHRTLQVEALQGGSSLSVYFLPSGHISGAALTILDITADQKFHRVVYSGDFCLHEQPSIPGAKVAQIPQPVDTLIMESVLAVARAPDRCHYDEQWQRLLEDVQGHSAPATLSPSGLPKTAHAFPRLLAVGILGECRPVVAGLIQAGVSGYILDTMLPVVSDLLQPGTSSQGGREMKSATLAECRNLLDAGHLVIVPDTHLTPASPSHQLAEQILENPRGFIGLFNSVRRRSPAGLLLARKPGQYVPWHGGNLKRGAQIRHYILSQHAPRTDLIATPQQLRARQTVLVHGTPRGLITLGEALQRSEYEGAIVSAVAVT